MKKYILPFMSIALLMAMASCSSSDDEVAEIKEESKLVPMTFTATQESNSGTRAALITGNSVVWQTDDKISVFDRTGAEGNHEFALTGNVKDGKFSGNASPDATEFTAVYPYTDGAQLGENGSVSGITLPAEQTATLNSFDPKAALMMAVSTEENKNKLDFKNAVSLVKVTTEFPCKKIVLSSNEVIAGTGTLNCNYSVIPSITFTSNQSKNVTLKPATVDGVIAAGTYYIAIRPHTSSGFSISFINSDDTKAYTRTSTNENTFKRSKIKNLGTFAESSQWTSTIESNGNVKASQQVDMGVFNIGGRNYRLIFTKSNLKKDGFLAEKETDYGDYFAWGATEPWYTSYTIGTDSNGKPTVTSDGWKTNYSRGYVSETAPTLGNKYTSEKDFDMSDDPAHQILKGAWQIPTKAIWNALVGINSKEWNSDKKGYEFKNNGQTLFLPAAGFAEVTSFYSVGSVGYYWSGTAYSTAYPSTEVYYPEAYYLDFKSGNVSAQSRDRRYYGYSVRPVRLVAE